MSDNRTDPQYKLRLTPAMKKIIEKRAQAAGRSLNQEIMFRLMQAYRYEPEFEEGNLQTTLAKETIHELRGAVAEATRQLNVMMLHIKNGDHPDTWDFTGAFKGTEDDELFEAFRAYSVELGPAIPLMDVVFICGRKWLEHVGCMPTTEGLSEPLFAKVSGRPRKSVNKAE